MRRPLAAVLAPLLLAAHLLAPTGHANAQPEATRPNILVVLTDDQGYAPVAAHGHPWIQTPHLDALHAQSARLTRFLVSPTCSPTRAALLTGRHPMAVGITHTINERERLSLDATTLADVLRDAGYDTGAFGKWHLGDEDPYQPNQRGFNEAFIHGAGGIGQAYNCSNADAPNNKYFNPVLRHNGAFVQTTGYCTDLFFDAAGAWMRDHARAQAADPDAPPFFCWLATNAPHGPFIAPPEYAQRFLDLGFAERPAHFYGMIENIDDNLGRLMQRLDDWGLAENTIVVFMSDNGMTPAGGGRPGAVLGTDAAGNELRVDNAGMRGTKGSPDEGGVRAPCFVRWPGGLPAGVDVTAVTAHIDLLPTLCDLAGVALPEPVAAVLEGRSAAPLLRDPDAAWPDRYLFTHVARWPVDADPDDHQWERFAVRGPRYRLVGDRLYDLHADPGQATNLAADHPAVVAEMREAFDAFWQRTRPGMVNEHVPMSPTRPYHEAFHAQAAADGIPAWDAPVFE